MHRTHFSLLTAALLGGASLLVPAQAMAQDPAPPPPAAAGAASPGGADHDQVVGSFGVGYLGLTGVTIGQLNVNGQNFSLGSRVVNAPIIGVRYWLQDKLGIDAGLGFGYESGKTTTKAGGTTTDVDKPSATAVLVHVGVPLVLGTPGKHHTFQVVPEANIGFASSTVKDTPPPGGTAGPDTDLSGFRLDIGARIGTEIQFGFIGLPKLALQATVGLYFTQQSFGAKRDQNELKDSNTGISTTVQAAPWAIFTNSIAALYYF